MSGLLEGGENGKTLVILLKRLHPEHIREGNFGKEMWKEIAAARNFIPQIMRHGLAGHREEHQIRLVREMPAGGFSELMGIRKMDETIPDIHRRTSESPGLPEGPPFGAGENLEEKRHAADSVGRGARALGACFAAEKRNFYAKTTAYGCKPLASSNNFVQNAAAC
jgi:hypothetical protein